MNLDVKDQQLITLLSENARLTTTDLSKRLRLSRTTVQSRLERLERHAVIGGYTIRLGSSYEKRLLEAHIMITTLPKQVHRVEAQLKNIAEISALYAVSGAYDMIVQVTVETIEKMNEVIDQIGLLEGVERTLTSIVLSKRFKRG